MKQLLPPTLLIHILFLTLLFSSTLSATPKIVFWNGHQHANYIADLVDEFQKSSGIEVELHQFLSDQLRDEVLVQAGSNSLPDLLYIPGDFVGLYQEISLTPVPVSWMSNYLTPRIKDVGKVNDHYYGVPLFQGNHLMLLYNRDLVKSPMLEWSELDVQMKAFPDEIKYPITWNYREMYWLIPFMSAFESWPLEGDKISLNTPQMEQALTFYKGLSDKNLVDSECDHDCGVELFKAGKTAYMINGDWVVRDLEEAMGDKLGIAMLPTIAGKPMVSMFSGYVLAYPNLSKDDAKFEILKKFTEFAQGKLAQKIIQEQGGLMPVNEAVLSEDKSEKSENEQAMLAQMRVTKNMPTSPNMSVAWSAMNKGFSRLMDHDYSVKKAMQEMQRVADRELKRRKKVSNNSL